jgi:hypothetical protein
MVTSFRSFFRNGRTTGASSAGGKRKERDLLEMERHKPRMGGRRGEESPVP